jgi:hypothetical protein
MMRGRPPVAESSSPTGVYYVHLIEAGLKEVEGLAAAPMACSTNLGAAARPSHPYAGAK